MWFCTFHFDKTFCADRFPATAGAINVRGVELDMLTVVGKGGIRENRRDIRWRRGRRLLRVVCRGWGR